MGKGCEVGGMASLPRVRHEVDFCVVGGGTAGVCAALAAARRGAKVALMQERPVLGGNASSEVRVHICGADRHNGIKHMRETGILEEIRLENLYRNPNKSFSIFDTILYEKVRFEPNITLLLNCSCFDAEMDGERIASVTGWQLTTQTMHVVRAKIFADCSGDGILAPLTGAEHRIGREGRDEFGEPLAPEKADRKTMGMTCLFQARRHDTPQSFIPPAWAHKYDRCEDIPYGERGHRHWNMGYWWIELGGEFDSIHDTEMLRDELLKITYGVWDHIKNSGRHPESANWAVEWIEFLPGKRESRRYIGEHILTENDLESEGRFADNVAYGGWAMDDHHPAGFRAVKIGGAATQFHRTPSPYGIPYRSLFAKRIENLMFAGRCASCTHMAMSSTRVMGTGAVMGQAVGTAAAIAVRHGIAPRDVLGRIGELQQALLADDCYIPWVPQARSPLMDARLSASQGDPEPVRDGYLRQIGDATHAWEHGAGDSVEYLFAKPVRVSKVVLTLDSGMDLNIQMSYHQPDDQLTAVPPVMQKFFRIEGLRGGQWSVLKQVANNYQRHVKIPVEAELEGVRYVLESTWGAPRCRLYGFHVS